MDGCIRPGAVTDDDLVAYAYGEAPPDVARHVDSCPACAAAAGEHARWRRRLVSLLYRVDCPPADTLGDYQLDMLAPAERQQVAAHLVDCPACAGELRELRHFLAAEPAPAPEGMIGQMKRIVAALLTPALEAAQAGVRGAGDTTSRAYQAGNLTINIRFSADARRAYGRLTGLIWQEDAAPEAVAGCEVRLIAEAGARRTTEISDLGDFAFGEVEMGSYRLEVELHDSVVVVEDLRLER